MAETIPNPGGTCGKMTGSGLVSYPCTLPPNHDGPCVVNELPATKIARERWLKTQEVPQVELKNHDAPEHEPTLGGEDAREQRIMAEKEVDAVQSADVGMDNSFLDSVFGGPEVKAEVLIDPPIDLGGWTADGALVTGWTTLRALEYDAVPSIFKILIQEAVMRKSLGVLWASADRLFRDGAERVTISREDLAAIVPPAAR